MITKSIKNILQSAIKLNFYGFADSISLVKKQKQSKIAKKLKENFNPTYLQVTDTTLGGSSCGQMYKIIIQSPLFQGKSRVMQHQMVSQCLAEQLKQIHAFNLKTKPSKIEPEINSKMEEKI